jgi:hypothetical protein
VVGSTALTIKATRGCTYNSAFSQLLSGKEELGLRKLIIQLFNLVNKKKSRKEEKQVKD